MKHCCGSRCQPDRFTVVSTGICARRLKAAGLPRLMTSIVINECSMTVSQSIASPVVFADPSPERLPTPKFQLGQQVLWAQVPTHGHGTIVGVVFASSVSVGGTGYHYAVQFDAASPSRADCPGDWAFERDLELLETHTHLLAEGGR